MAAAFIFILAYIRNIVYIVKDEIQWSFVMNIDRAVLTLAGSMVLLSASLAWLVSPYWLLLNAFVGANMLQAAFTGFCPAAMIFRKLSLKAGPAFGHAADAPRG
jgi:hypothetical protein